MTLAVVLVLLGLAPIGAGAAVAPAGARLWTMWAVGAMLTGVTVTVCLAVRLPVTIAMLILAVAMAAGARRLRSALRAAIDAPRREWWLRGWLVVLLAAGIIVTLAVPVLDSDAVAIWHRKVRDFLGMLPFDQWAVPFYPPLGAVLWGVPLLAAGPEYEAAGRCVVAAFYVAWAAALRECCPRPLSPAAVMAIAGVALAGFDHRFITSGYQDPLLASAAGIAAVWLACDLIDRRAGSAATGLALSGALGLIKAEGLALGLIMAGSWLAVRLITRRGGRRDDAIPLGAIAVFAAMTMTWPAIRAAYGIVPDGAAFIESTSPLLLWTNRDRLPAILEAFRSLRPGYLLPMAAATVVMTVAWRAAPALRGALAWLSLVLLLYTSATISVFLITTAPLDWHLSTLLTRMAGQLLPIWYLAIVLVAGASPALLAPLRSRVFASS